MEFGQNMMLLRKQQKLSQAALGKLIGASGDVIGSMNVVMQYPR